MSAFTNTVAVAAGGAPPLSITISQSLVSGSSSGFSACGNPGNTTTASGTAEGGAGGYTYQWTGLDTASSGPYQANAPTSSSTTFSDANSSVCDGDLLDTESWELEVTDDNSDTATDTVNVRLTWINLN